MLYIQLNKYTEIILQPFGSFIVNRKRNIYEVVNKIMTSSFIMMVTESLPYKSLVDKLFIDPVSKEQFDLHIKKLVNEGYLVQFNQNEAPICNIENILFAEDNNILKATHAEIEITNRCNLKCDYCYAEANSSNLELNNDEWLEILLNMYDKGLRAITISGGEPFIRNNFLELIEKLSSKFIISIYSNGFFITDKVASILKDYNIRAIQISLDSYTPEHHDSIRGNGSHAKAIKAIKHLTSYNIPVQISTVITKNNFNQLNAIQKYCYDIGATFQADAVKLLGRAKNINAKLWKKYFESSYINNYSLSKNNYTINPLCQAQIGFIAISHTGILKPCNQREAFFNPTKDFLLQAKESQWWKDFYGNNKLGANISKTQNIFAKDIHPNLKANCKLQNIFIPGNQ